MRTIKAEVANASNIAEFGTFFDVKSAEVRTGTGGWEAWSAKEYMVDTPLARFGIMGMKGLPFTLTQMTRNTEVDEALIPGNCDFVVVLANTQADQADTKDAKAFIIPQGTAIKLKKGVWHSACRYASEAEGDKFCYFLIDSKEVVYSSVAGEPVEITH